MEVDVNPELPGTRTWTPGTIIGAFELIREIARGGMGEIWLARQRGPAEFERLVVLKRILASPEDDESSLDMFLDEARISAQLQHPNIVQTFELGEAHGSYFLAMEFLTGQTVSRVARRLIENQQHVPIQLGVEIVMLAARGLGYAHRRRGLDGELLHIVHRDVSPQNLFVTYDGQVKVLDFGVAKATGRRSRTSTGLIKGKLSYMSPEQALHLPVAPSADVFSLGVILFELVTSTRLYDNADEVTVLRRLSDATTLPKASERANIPPELDELISKALRWNALNRFEDGVAFADALEAWLHANPRDAATPSLKDTMQAHFAQEMAALPLMKRMSALTPTNEVAPSIPDKRDVIRTERHRPSTRRTVALIMAFALAAGIGAASVAFWPSKRGGSSPSQNGLSGEPTAAVFDAGVNEPDVSGAALVAQALDGGAADALDSSADARPKNVIAKKGMLTLETDPWAHVFLGKRLLGETPLIKVPLPPGKYTLRLVNERERLDTDIEVEIAPDAVTAKRLVF